MPKQSTRTNLKVETPPLITPPATTSSGERVTRLFDIVRSLSTITQPEMLLGNILDAAIGVVDARGGFLMLIDPESNELRCYATSGELASGLQGAAFKIDQRTVPGMVAVHGSSYRENDVSHSPFFTSKQRTSPRDYAIHKLMCAPLKVGDRVTGVVQVMDKQTGADFDEDDERLLQAVAGTAASLIENLRLYQAERTKNEGLEQALKEMRNSYHSSLQAISSMLDARDNAVSGHSNRVVAITMRLVQALGLTDPARLRSIQIGALLHDVGKLRVPDSVLGKSGQLDGEDWQKMRAHPDLGYRMLRHIDFLHDALPIVRYHHERYNGTGYPYGLEGKQIPLDARIFAVADAFDAIMSERPYKKARTYEEAVTVFKEDNGRFFDPVVVEVFLSVPKEDWLAIFAQPNLTEDVVGSPRK